MSDEVVASTVSKVLIFDFMLSDSQFLVQSSFKKDCQLRKGNRPVLNGHGPFPAGILDPDIEQFE